MLHAGVIDENVEAAAGRERLLYEPPRAARRGEIDGGEARAGDARRLCLPALDIHVCQGDRGAGPRQRVGGRQANPAGGAGDERRPAGEIRHTTPPRLPTRSRAPPDEWPRAGQGTRRTWRGTPPASRYAGSGRSPRSP